MNTKDRILGQIVGAQVPAANVPATTANALRANPTGLNEASEYVQAPKRPDLSTLANVAGGYYGRTDENPGNSVSDSSLAVIRTLNATAKPNRTSPAGPARPGGGIY